MSKGDFYQPLHGLTKREHFAAKAIVPVDLIVAILQLNSTNDDKSFTTGQYLESAVAYKIAEADRLIKALEKKQ